MKNCLDSSGDSLKENLDNFDMETGEYNMNTLGNGNSLEQLETSKDLLVIVDSSDQQVLKHNDSFNDQVIQNLKLEDINQQMKTKDHKNSP